MELFNIAAGLASILSLILSIINYQNIKNVESKISNNNIKQVVEENTMTGNNSIIQNGINVNDNKSVKQ